jgi:putative transposase
MKEIKTISVKLNELDKEEYLSLLKESSCLFNYYTKWAYETKSFNKGKCHKENYFKVQTLFPNIKTALVQSIRNNALESVKSRKFKCKQPIKKETSGLRLDKRAITVRNNQITIIGISKRHKEILHVPNIYKNIFESWNFKMATLTYQKKKNQFWINLVFENPIEVKQQIPKSSKEIIGIDRGLYHIAVTSDKQFFSAKEIRKQRRKHLYVKKTLQQKGTQSAKRKLKKISGKEKRFMKDVNHCITKKIVNNPEHKIFVLEKLTNIRNKRKGKKFNKLLSNWSFYQFEQFLTYKAYALGKQVVYIDPHYTSQKCSKCGDTNKESRNKSQYKCKNCGYFEHADINASYNIKYNYTISIAQLESMEQAFCQHAECKEATHLQAPRSLV